MNDKYYLFGVESESKDEIKKICLARHINFDSDLIVSYSISRCLMFFDTKSCKKVYSKRVHKKPIIALATTMALECKTPCVAVVGQDNRIVLLDSSDGSLLKTVKPKTTQVRAIALHSGPLTKTGVENIYLVVAGKDFKLYVWDLTHNECIRVFKGHKDSVYSVTIGVIDRSEEHWSVMIISTSADKTARSWNLTKGELKHVYRHKSAVGTAYISSQGHLATGTSDGTLYIWDEESGIMLFRLLGHQDAIFSIDFWYGHEILVVSGSMDETIRVWDIAQGGCVCTLVGHNSAVKSVAVSVEPDPKIISCSADGCIKTWDLQAIINDFFR
jgi:WD40 repeat protein